MAIGAVAFGEDIEREVTGKKSKNPYTLEAIIGAQAPYLPQLYAVKEERKKTDDLFALEQKKIDTQVNLLQEELSALTKRTEAEIASDTTLSDRRIAIETQLADYERVSNELIAKRSLEAQQEQAKMANMIGVAQLGTTGALAYGSLKGAGVIGGVIGGGEFSGTGFGAYAGGAPVAGTLAGDTALASTAPALGGGTTGFTVGETMGSSAGSTAGFGSYLGAAGVGYGVGSMTSKALGGGPKGTFGGALSGAVAGALYGTYIMPGIGTGIGAVIGSLSGAFGGSGKCCFIFIASHGYLHPIVRRYRDAHMTVKNRRGYYWLADRLVPQMAKRKWVSKLVEWGMVRPMTEYGKYYYGVNKVGAIFAGLTEFWLVMFDILGRRPPYRRRGTGEVV